jgi:glycosyltransferase involved in cell wall biosynthesis
MKNGTNVNPEYEAKKFNIMDKHTAEVACANFSDVFTTVSDITANETKYLLHKVPDFVLKNGIDSDAFGTTEYLLERDSKFKEKIRDIVADQFFPYYTFDLDETSFIFTSGRYEFHDKGVDVFIKSLAKLNAELKNPANKASDRTVVAFFFMPAGQHGITTEFNENKGKYGLDKREGCPALTTHYMNEEGNDPIIRSLRQNDLINKREDNVKVLFVPIYLEKTDGIFNLPYYETISGFDLGVFGSYYEPWGYTPQECLALAIPTVTTNYAGFGSFMDKNVKDKFKRMKGSYVADRSKTEEECVEEISKHLLKFVKKYRPEKRDCKIVAKELSRIVDWKIFVENYMKAYEMAEKK